jgi:hypothetical protein
MKWFGCFSFACLALGAVAQAPLPAPSEVRAAPVQPPIPRAPSPTERFRELMTAAPADRVRMLERKGPAARQLIESKIIELSQLRPEERELRLRLAQLQESLRPLLRAAPDQRAFLLTQVAEEDRELISERLTAWDAMTETARRDVLESDEQFGWFVRRPGADARQLAAFLAQLAPQSKAAASAQMDRWLAIAPAERERKTAAFQRFFDLNAAERAKALRTLTEVELRQMERTLADFRELSAGEREACVQGFQRFQALETPARDQFLKNAVQWQAMTPTERATWRRLVRSIHTPPPLPPFPNTMELAVTNR